MSASLRQRAKAIFDGFVYQYPLANRVARNLNKRLLAFTSFRLRPCGTLRVLLKNGKRIRIKTNETSVVTKLLFWNGYENFEYTRIFEKLIMRCSSFIDVGANIGYYSLLAGTLNPKTKVYAIEPAQAPRHFLSENIALNRLDAQVKAYAVALSDKAGEARFFEHRNPDGYRTRHNLAGTHSIKEAAANETRYETVVPAETLDSFIARHQIDRPDLIKLDVEGAENMILAGARNTLTNHKPIVICETLFNAIEAELEAIMLQHGYHFYNHKDGKLHKTDTLKRATDNGIRDCFFAHPEKEQWILEFLR